MKRIGQWWECVRRTPRVSPGGYVLYAAVVAVLYVVVHLLGSRECASIASGTPHSLLGSEALGVALGAAYIVLYFALVTVAPILVIAAGVWVLGRRVLAGGRQAAEAGET